MFAHALDSLNHASDKWLCGSCSKTGLLVYITSGQTLFKKPSETFQEAFLMEDAINEAKAAPVERPSEADPSCAYGSKDRDDQSGCFVISKYLTVDITNGKDATLTELRQHFHHIRILKLPYPIFGNQLSIYRIDPNKLTIENYEKRLKK